MARKPAELDADGLPKPLPIRPIFRFLPIVLGVFQGLAILIILQQMGKIVASAGALVVAVLLGILFGIALPSIAYLFAASSANRKLAAERQRRFGHVGGTQPPPTGGV